MFNVGIGTASLKPKPGLSGPHQRTAGRPPPAARPRKFLEAHSGRAPSCSPGQCEFKGLCLQVVSLEFSDTA